MDMKEGVAYGTFIEIAISLKKRGFDLVDLVEIDKAEYDKLKNISIKFTQSMQLMKKARQRNKRIISKAKIVSTWYSILKNIIF